MIEASEEPKWYSIYFRPDQIVFHITGDETQASSEKLLEWANEVAKTIDLQILVPRIKTFPRTLTRGGKESDVIAEVEKFPRREPHSFVYANVQRLSDGKPLIAAEEKDLDLLLDLILLLDERRKEIDGIPLQVVSPNWLTSGSSQPGATGGPGGKPTPYWGAPENSDYQFSFDSRKADRLRSMPEFLNNLKQGNYGKGVTVAILDTAPEPEELDTIYDEWVIKDDRKHSLIDTLLDPANRMLTVHPDPRVTSSPLRDLQCIGYDYVMNDHGLFVAGIIHSLAREAELHLYQVLNRYGVGDMEIINDALEQIITDFRDGGNVPLVINMSLTFNLPLGHKHTREGKPDVSDRIGPRILENDAEHDDQSWYKRVRRMMEPFGDLFADLGPGVIAAAGNDYDASRDGNQRPKARYPAAFDSVVGVGALPRSASPGFAGVMTASYSNIADSPPSTGIASLGGEEGEGKGVLGIYVGKFPKQDDEEREPPNESGWAWWCGTSFATPIITGLVAALMSSLPSITGVAMSAALAQNAVDMIHAAQDHWTSNGEDVFYLIQGPPGIS